MNGLTLRGWRNRRGWTQEQLAAVSGLEQSTISRLETDPDANPTDDTKERLAKALGIAPSKIRFTEPEPEASVDPEGDREGHKSEKAASR